MADLWEAADAAMKNSNYGAAVATQADATKRAQFLGILQKTLESYSGVAKEIAAVRGPEAALKAMSGPIQGVNRFVELMRKQGLPLPEDLGQQILSAVVQTPTVEEAGAAQGASDYRKGAVQAQKLMDVGAPQGAALGAAFPGYTAGLEAGRPKPTMEGAFGLDQDTGRIVYSNPEILGAKQATAAAGAGKTQVSVDTGTKNKAILEATAPDMVKVMQEEQGKFNVAGDMLGKISQLRELYSSGNIGGPGTSLRRDFINLATSLGVNLSKIGINDETVPTEEVLGALTNELTLTFKKMYDLGAQGFTDKDLVYTNEIADTVKKNPEARDLLLESWELLAKAQQKKALVANELVHGYLSRAAQDDFTNPLTRVDIAKAQQEATGDVFAGLGARARELNKQYEKRRAGATAAPAASPPAASPQETPASDLFRDYPQFAPKGGK